MRIILMCNCHRPLSFQGAFYIYADTSNHTDDSYRFAQQLLEEAGVAVTPGIDFGCNDAERHLRFAYTTSRKIFAKGLNGCAVFSPDQRLYPYSIRNCVDDSRTDSRYASIKRKA